MVVSDASQLDIIWVHEKLRRKGIGRKMLMELKNDGNRIQRIDLPAPEVRQFFEKMKSQHVLDGSCEI